VKTTRAGTDRSRISGSTLPDRISRAHASLFAALGDEKRLRLLARLATGPASISLLAEGSGITRQGVTKHLRVLAQARLVRGRRRGKESVWQLERRRLDEARRTLDMISRQWDASLGKLKDFVERQD
jgi:DNA-binding transcriptional ArsR family regulator